MKTTSQDGLHLSGKVAEGEVARPDGSDSHSLSTASGEDPESPCPTVTGLGRKPGCREEASGLETMPCGCQSPSLAQCLRTRPGPW